MQSNDLIFQDEMLYYYMKEVLKRYIIVKAYQTLTRIYK